MKITKTENIGGEVIYHVHVPNPDVAILGLSQYEVDEMSRMGSSKKISDNVMALFMLVEAIEKQSL